MSFASCLAAYSMLAIALACSDSPSSGSGDPSPAARYPGASYVDDVGCAECHAYEFERWTGSHHDLAMQVATDETVLGDFADVTFEHPAHGETTRFFRDGERFLVDAFGPDGERADFEVRYTFGVEPLQQFLIELPGGRLQSLTVAWDTERESWFSLYPDERFAHDDPLHWTGRYQRWNAMCAECHSTDLRKGYDPETDSYTTTWEELDVGCQACHGPGSEHAAWAEADARGEMPGSDWPGGNGLTTELRREAQTPQIDACAPCHSRRTMLTEEMRPGEPFLDQFLPERLRAGFYHADGQIQGEVYVYGSFAQSKMFQNGVACTDCHDPHALELLVPGNGLCTQCHTTEPPLDRFPTLEAKEYDTRDHHHHEEGTEGARCVSCHMAATTYMEVDPRRDHSFRLPRPDLAEMLGTPDACSACHAEGPRWAAERVVEWFGEERPQHFAPLFAAGRARIPEALEPLAMVATDPESPPIVRATAFDLLGEYGNRALQVAVAGVEDSDPLARASAVRALDELPAEARVLLVAPLLEDPRRVVRIEAARVLSSLPRAEVPAEHHAALDAAVAEFLAAQEVQADLPGSRLNLGVFHAGRGDLVAAEAAYRAALELDPYFLPGRFNLANLLNRMQRNRDAEEVLRRGVFFYPEEGELHFSLALLLAEMERMPEAADSMQLAARFAPDRPRVHYNLGLLLRDTGRAGEAQAALRTAVARDPSDPDPMHALALIHVDREEWQDALPLAERLVTLRRGDPVSQELYERVRRELGR